MPEFVINVNEIENLQMVSDTIGLEQIFTRAKSIIIQGGTVVLTRTYANGKTENFDALTTEFDLENYRESVFKYL